MSEEIVLTLDFPGMRLDRALALARPDQSRMVWQKLIKDKKVMVNGKVGKPSMKLVGGEVVKTKLPEVVEIELIAEDIPLDIVYEDDDCIVINKPAGMVVHPAVGHASGTLVNAVMHHCPDLAGIGGELRPGIVHRLDKDTSGLIVVAKNDAALRHLQAQFKERTVHKLYIALCDGDVSPEKALVDAPIGRDPKARKRMAVIGSRSSAQSREAQTQYEVVEQFDKYSLVHCQLFTGRTHQIRVHMAYVGYPLVGDTIYGRRKQDLLNWRHFLHAAELGFNLPSNNEPIVFKSELPIGLAKIIDRISSKPIPVAAPEEDATEAEEAE